jgi:hypothetical protein
MLGTSVVNRLGHYYQLVRETKTQAEAVSAARSYLFQGMPGHLVTIQDEAENAFVRSLLPPGIFVWIDGSDLGQEGTWKFTQGPQAGSAMTYTNWFSAQPNGGTGENIVVMQQASGRWEDTYTSLSFWFVVEYECLTSCSPCMPIEYSLDY